MFVSWSKLSFFFFLFCSPLFSGSFSFAAESGISFRIHHQYQSPRALGMGDAFVAVANDYTALFYNPAGLARRTEGQMNLSFGLGGTSSFSKTAEELDKAQKTPGGESAQQQAIIDVINKNAGNTYGVRVEGPNAIWVRPNWGVAFIPADVSVQLDLHNQVGPAINATVYADSTLAYGYGGDLDWIADSRLSWGVTAKLVNRGFASKSISAIEAAVDSSLVRTEDLKEGYTVDADLGMLWTPNIPEEGIFSLFSLARPTFGVVVRNVAELGFGQSMQLINKTKTEAPEKLYRVVDIGTRWEYPTAWIFSGRGTLDVRDIGHPLFNARKGVHAGFEFDWTVATWWKGHYNVGINQGFWTAGVGAQLGWFNLEVVSYADDVGTYNTPKESRNYMARLNLDF